LMDLLSDHPQFQREARGFITDLSAVQFAVTESRQAQGARQQQPARL